MFTQALLDHFQHPRNAGELPNSDATVEVSNPVCGDVLRLSAKIENGTIRDVKFLCRGCTASIACASLLTETVRGKGISEVRSLTPQWIALELGGLPEASFHAAQLACDALCALLRSVNK